MKVRRAFLCALALVFITIFVAGCGQSKMVGTWIGPTENGFFARSAPVIKIEQKDDKTFSVKLSSISENPEHGRKIEDYTIEDITEGKETFMLATKTENDNILDVQAGLGKITIGYDKDKDVLLTAIGSQTKGMKEFQRIKNDKDKDEAKKIYLQRLQKKK